MKPPRKRKSRQHRIEANRKERKALKRQGRQFTAEWNKGNRETDE